MPGKTLNVDYPKAITEFEAVMREFKLKERIYKVIFRGKGLEFDGYRNYSPDDDASNIDWKASTRSGNLLTKQYIEERDQKILLVVDSSENMVFGSTEKLKCEYSAEVCAALSHLVVSSGDNIGFLIFNDVVREYAPPTKGLKKFNIFLDRLSDPEIYRGDSNLKAATDFLLQSLDTSISAVIFLTDLSRFSKSFIEELKLISYKFETIILIIKDPLDKTLPSVNNEIIVEDPGTKQRILLNPGLVKNLYEKQVMLKDQLIKQDLKKINVDYLELVTDKKFAVPLAEFFMERLNRGKLVV